MSQETELIKEKVEIVGLVSEYVSLKQMGQTFKGLCPFHQEKTPSFIVSPARNTWHCFGCSEGGDIFSFVQKIENIDFPAALKMLAERAGVVLPAYEGGGNRNRRQRLFDVMGDAATFYHRLLLEHVGGKKAKGYLQGRGVTEKTMKLFVIGYAPMQWDTLGKWLMKKGYTADELVAVGLIGKNQRGGYYDRFRGRIMFPVQDVQGRVVAFGGRIVPWHETGNEGKYVNSSETELYEKRRVVYNLNRAKQFLRHGTPCLVVEGYMDVVMMVQAGIPNVVASSGTAFTVDQMGQLSRFTPELHFAFDADGAGWKATVAATEAALLAGVSVATVKLPEGKDPADICLEEPDMAKGYFSTSYSLISVLLEQFKRSSEISSQEDQLAALTSLLAKVMNPITQGKMIQEVMDVLHVPEAQIRKLLVAAPRPLGTTEPSFEGSGEAGIKGFLPIWHLLGLLIIEPGMRQFIWEGITEDMLVDSQSQMLYNSMQHLVTAQSDFFTMPSSALLAVFPQEIVSFAEAISARVAELRAVASMPADEEAQHLVFSLQKQQLLRKLKVLQQKLASAPEAERYAVLQQFQLVAEELSAIGS